MVLAVCTYVRSVGQSGNVHCPVRICSVSHCVCAGGCVGGCGGCCVVCASVSVHLRLCVCMCLCVLLQVLEMNASSQRSRSQVMSHLMEASLSHQVKTSGTLSTFFAPSTQPKADHRPAGNKSKAASRGITSFFKPVGPKGSADKEKPRSDGRTCTESSDGGAASKSQKKVVAANPGCANVHLAKTGLILLEDVSVCVRACVCVRTCVCVCVYSESLKATSTLYVRTFVVRMYM